MISLSQERNGYWQCYTVIFKFKLTPGAAHSSSRFSYSKTTGDSLERERVHTWFWLCGRWNNQVPQSAPVPETLLVISNFISFFQIKLFFPLPQHISSLDPFRIFPGGLFVVMSLCSLVSSYFHCWPREGKKCRHHKILMLRFKKLRISQIQIDGRGRGVGVDGGEKVQNCWKLNCFVYFKRFLLSLAGISQCDLNLFIIFEGISPIGPCE